MTAVTMTPAATTRGASKGIRLRPVGTGGGATQGFFSAEAEKQPGAFNSSSVTGLEAVSAANADHAEVTAERDVNGPCRASENAGDHGSPAAASRVIFSRPDLSDPAYLTGCGAIGKALGLGRAATKRLIEASAIQTTMIDGMRCASRADVARYLADQINTDTWDNEGGAPAPDRGRTNLDAVLAGPSKREGAAMTGSVRSLGRPDAAETCDEQQPPRRSQPLRPSWSWRIETTPGPERTLQMKTLTARRPMPLLTALLSTAAPVGVCGPVMAQTDVAAAIAKVDAAFGDFKKKYDGRVNEIEATVDQLSISAAHARLSGSGEMDTHTPPDPDYSRTFATWFRKGDSESDLKAANATGTRQAVQAAMSGGADDAGGYLAPVEWDRRINKALVPISPMRQVARVIPTTVRAYSTLYSADGWGSGWVGETAARPATSTPTLDPLTFPHGEIYANPGVTQNLLDDADFNLTQWLADEVGEEFAKQEGIAFISGNGVNKPRGLLTYVVGGASDAHHPGGNIPVVVSGAAAALPNGDGLIDFVYALPSPYRQNARWLMNSMTAAAIAKFKDGDGNYLWRETYVAGQPATLLGYPVVIDENMPDVAAGTIPIAFGDFQRGYVINDRQGVRVLRDPFTNKPYVHFYTTKRVGGGVDDPKALRLLKIAAA